MRLWHEDLLPLLDRQRLLAQHHECAALRGLGWGKKHATVDYVFTHDPALLIAYHKKVMNVMRDRGYKPDPIWEDVNYRGKVVGYDNWTTIEDVEAAAQAYPIFPEHNADYYTLCMNLLKQKAPELYKCLEV